MSQRPRERRLTGDSADSNKDADRQGEQEGKPE